jgi:hypothetical protein
MAESMDNNYEGRSDKKRRSWTKPVDLFLRSCHIGTTSVLFGGIVWAVPHTRLSTWHYLAIATGSALIIFNIFRCRHWPYQGRGMAAWLHIGLLWLAYISPELKMPVLSTALAVGVIGSHMPGSIRHWSLVHGRRIE